MALLRDYEVMTAGRERWPCNASAARSAERIGWQDLDWQWLREVVRRARVEDLAGAGFLVEVEKPGDATTSVLLSALGGREVAGGAALVAREPMVVCGLPLVAMILEEYAARSAGIAEPGAEIGRRGQQPEVIFEEAVAEGSVVPAGAVLGWLRGDVGVILTAERVVLNFLQRLSGVATETARYVAALGTDGPRLLDTRKTTPGLRALEKLATATGGGWNHRRGLYDRILLKDNHLALLSGGPTGISLPEAVGWARRERPDLLVEVELDRLDQIPLCLEAGADIVMLDNFSNDQIREAVALIGGRAATEASGGITLNRCSELKALGLDFVSTGATVHRAVWVDIGLDWSV